MKRAAALGAAIVVASAALAAALAANGDPMQAADLDAGRDVYGRCLACHAIEYDRVGPRHCGLFGRRAGTVPGFPYSEAMRRSGIVWSPESLDAFLRDPPGFVPGTHMTYAGVPEPGARGQLIAWLEFATAPSRCRSHPPDADAATGAPESR